MFHIHPQYDKRNIKCCVFLEEKAVCYLGVGGLVINTPLPGKKILDRLLHFVCILSPIAIA